jgi:hypothetical protein
MSTASSLPTAEQVEAAIARALARPEFHAPEGPWERMVAWLREHAAILWHWLHGLFALNPDRVRETGETLLWVVTAIAVGVAVLGVAKLLRMRPVTERKHSPPGPHVASARERSLEAQLTAAAEAASSGAFLVAAHALYLAVLLWLDGAGHARFTEDKTGAEYVRELRPPALRKAFTVLLHAFYPVAYGGRPDAPGAYARMRALASRIGVPER